MNPALLSEYISEFNMISCVYFFPLFSFKLSIKPIAIEQLQYQKSSWFHVCGHIGSFIILSHSSTLWSTCHNAACEAAGYLIFAPLCCLFMLNSHIYLTGKYMHSVCMFFTCLCGFPPCYHSRLDLLKHRNMAIITAY